MYIVPRRSIFSLTWKQLNIDLVHQGSGQYRFSDQLSVMEEWESQVLNKDIFSIENRETLELLLKILSINREKNDNTSNNNNSSDNNNTWDMVIIQVTLLLMVVSVALVWRYCCHEYCPTCSETRDKTDLLTIGVSVDDPRPPGSLNDNLEYLNLDHGRRHPPVSRKSSVVSCQVRIQGFKLNKILLNFPFILTFISMS